MSRAGTKKRPYYRIVVTNSRSPRDSKFIEKIGTYSPLLANDNDKRVVIDSERAKYWLSKGAQMSRRIHLFFNAAGLVETKPLQRAERKARKDKGADAAAAPEAAAAAPVAEAPKEEAKSDEAAAPPAA